MSSLENLALSNQLASRALETMHSTGLSPNKYISASGANQDAQVIKAAPGILNHLSVSNINAAARYLKLYDKSTGPTSGDTPVQTILVPAAQARTIDFTSLGLAFAAGISFRLTTGVADNDANAVASGELVVNWGVR